jgi:hypothetical protein
MHISIFFFEIYEFPYKKQVSYGAKCQISIFKIEYLGDY